jgi:hypothetical protein
MNLVFDAVDLFEYLTHDIDRGQGAIPDGSSDFSNGLHEVSLRDRARDAPVGHNAAMNSFRRRWLAVVTVSVLGLVLCACVESGEIAVRNSTDQTIIALAHSGECRVPSTDNRPWIAITPATEQDFVVASGSWLGDACLSVLAPESVSVEVGPGRLYEVTQGSSSFAVQDIGPHDEPWYFDMQRYQWSWSSWWVWLSLVPILFGAPVGLFITARFFYRFYVLKQPY